MSIEVQVINGATLDRIMPGDTVQISFPTTEKTNNPARRLDGNQYVVATVNHSYKPGQYRNQYTLYGAESEAGVPYVFLDDELIKL